MRAGRCGRSIIAVQAAGRRAADDWRQQQTVGDDPPGPIKDFIIQCIASRGCVRFDL